MCSGTASAYTPINNKNTTVQRITELPASTSGLFLNLTRVVKRSSKHRSWIYKFEIFSFLAFAIRSVIVPRGCAFNKPHSCIVCHCCTPSSEVKHGYTIVIATVDGQRDVTCLVQLLNFFHPWAATDSGIAVARGQCSRHVH